MLLIECSGETKLRVYSGIYTFSRTSLIHAILAMPPQATFFLPPPSTTAQSLIQ